MGADRAGLEHPAIGATHRNVLSEVSEDRFSSCSEWLCTVLVAGQQLQKAGGKACPIIECETESSHPILLPPTWMASPHQELRSSTSRRICRCYGRSSGARWGRAQAGRRVLTVPPRRSAKAAYVGRSGGVGVSDMRPVAETLRVILLEAQRLKSSPSELDLHGSNFMWRQHSRQTVITDPFTDIEIRNRVWGAFLTKRGRSLEEVVFV